MEVSFVRRHKDEISSIASIVSIISAVVLIVSLIIGSWQFYLTRQAIQAQAIGNSLAHGRDLYDALATNPDLAQRLFGVATDRAEEIVFVQKTMSFLSEQYIYREAGLIDDGSWALVERDMCQTYQLPDFRAIAEPLLARGDFPSGFTNILEGC